MVDPRLETFARALGAPGVVDDAFSFERGGIVFSGRALRAPKGKLQGASLSIAFEGLVTAAPILLRRERFTDRLGKWFRINREFAAGDSAFDAQVYFEADVPDSTLARIFGEKPIRVAALHALESGAVVSLRILPEGKLVYTVPVWNFFDPKQVSRALESAKALIDGLQAVPRGSLHGYRGGVPLVLEGKLPSRRLPFFAVLGYVVALWIVTGLLRRPPTLDYDAAHVGLYAGALASVLHLAPLGLLYRGRSTSFRGVIIASLFLTPTLLVAGQRVATWANAALDHGPRTTVACALKVVRPSKGSPYFWATIPDGASAQLELSIETPTWMPTLTIGQGALGARWVESVQPVTDR
jgi:hypothetical protein